MVSVWACIPLPPPALSSSASLASSYSAWLPRPPRGPAPRPRLPRPPRPCQQLEQHTQRVTENKPALHKTSSGCRISGHQVQESRTARSSIR